MFNRCILFLVYFGFRLPPDFLFFQGCVSPSLYYASGSLLSIQCGSGSLLSLYCGSESDFNFNADPDPSHQSEAKMRPLVYRPSEAQFFCVHASIVSVHGPPWLHSKPLKLLNFDLMWVKIQLFTLMYDPASRNNAVSPDPDPQPSAFFLVRQLSLIVGNNQRGHREAGSRGLQDSTAQAGE
jgi:hypothetical protein